MQNVQTVPEMNVSKVLDQAGAEKATITSKRLAALKQNPSTVLE